MSELLAGWFIALGVLVLLIYGLIAGHHECPDSPDGEHEDFTTRNELGTAVQCVWCCRMTSGVDVWRRKAER